MSPTVLIIEDEPDIQVLIQANLQLDGHTVVVADNGLEGLDAFRRHRPDIVLLDVMMPGIDGWEVLTQLKSDTDATLSSVPVLMLTALTDTMDRLRGEIEGAVRYLTKPFSPAELRAEVREALTGLPEPVRRRQVQRDALAELARMEVGSTTGRDPGLARPRLSRLEPEPVARTRPPRANLPVAQLGLLSAKQRQLIAAVGATSTVSEAADHLEVSRSNVYASLRRIARKLGVRSVTELVTLARAGGLG